MFMETKKIYLILPNIFRVIAICVFDLCHPSSAFAAVLKHWAKIMMIIHISYDVSCMYYVYCINNVMLNDNTFQILFYFLSLQYTSIYSTNIDTCIRSNHIIQKIYYRRSFRGIYAKEEERNIVKKKQHSINT